MAQAYEIEIGGKTYDVEADSEEEALKVAEEYHMTEGAMDRSIDSIGNPGPIKEGAFDRMNNTMRSVARGAPVIGGAADEIAAVGDTALSYPFEMVNRLLGREFKDEDWRKASESGMSARDRVAMALRKEQGKDEDYDEEHPQASTIAKLLGAAGGGVALASLIPGAFTGKTLAASMGKGGVSGGAIAGAHAFAEDNGDLEERGKHALKSGAKGVALGAAFPLAFHGAEQLYHKGRDAFGSMTGLFGLPSKAQKEVTGLFQGDGVDEAALRNLADDYPAMTLSDDAASLGEQIAKSPTNASDAMVKAANAYKMRLVPHGEQGADQLTHRAIDQSDRIIAAGKTSSQTIAKEVAERLGAPSAAASQPGVVRSVGNVTSLLGKGAGDWVTEVATAIGNKMRAGQMDKNFMEAARMIMGSGGEMADVFARVAASQASSAAQASAITSVLRSLTPGAISYSTGGKF